MRGLWGVMAAAVLGVALAQGQTAASHGAKVPKFEVTVVKENKSGAMNAKSMYEPGGISAVNATVVMLLRQAYRLYSSNDELIKGLPGWAADKHFDVTAKVAPEDLDRMKTLTQAERAEMLQGLLAERFGLVAHRVKVEQPVYALVVAKGGPKMTAWQESGDTLPNGLAKTDGRAGGMFQWGDGVLKAEGVALDELLGVFTQETQRTVLNETGLTGRYSFTLNWTPEEASDAGADNGKVAAPGLFTAMQEQLGLKLEAKRGPVDGLVVDKLELPKGN